MSAKKIGLTIFDIDETLFHTNAKIKVIKDKKLVKVLDNQEYNKYKLKPGETFDYGQFKSAKVFKETSTPIARLINRAKRIIYYATKKGSKVIIVTARTDMDDKKLFKEAFREQGIDIGRVYVERAGNLGNRSASENKSIIFKKYLDTNKYARIRLFDDSLDNLRAFLSLKEQYPDTEFTAYKVYKNGNTRII